MKRIGLFAILLLISGFALLPESFAQNKANNSDFFSSLSDLFEKFFPTGDIQVTADSDQITIVMDKSNTDSDVDKEPENNVSSLPSFASATVDLSSNTSLGFGEKVTLCHIPPGNPDNATTISIGNAAVAAHLNHGDYLGECEESNHTAETSIQEFENATVEVSSRTSVDSKMTLCHVPPGNPSKAHTITVNNSAVNAHLAHGDYLGECNASDEIPSEKDPMPNVKSKDKGNSNKNKN